MTEITKQKILGKLELLREHIGYLRTLQKEIESQEQFLSDFHLFGNTERYLQLAIQSIIDISHLLIIDLNLKRPDDNYEAISLLFEHNVISEQLANTMTKMVGLRNILVHEYGKIDRKKVYTILTDHIGDLEAFQQRVIAFLEQN